MRQAAPSMPDCARCEDGVATVEFALWSVFVFAVLLVGFDFGLYSIYQARLARSVSEASNFAFANFAFEKTVALDEAAVTQIGQYVANSSDLPGEVDISVSCNIDEDCADADRGWACLNSDGTLAAAASEDAVCTSGVPAGYYLTVRAEYTYAQQVIANPFLNGAHMVQTSTVRLL